MTQQEYHYRYFSYKGRPMPKLKPDGKIITDYLDKPTVAILISMASMIMALW